MRTEQRNREEIIESLAMLPALVSRQNDAVYLDLMNQGMSSPSGNFKPARAESGIRGIQLESNVLLKSIGLFLRVESDNGQHIHFNGREIKPGSRLCFEIIDGRLFAKYLSGLNREEVASTKLGGALSTILVESVNLAVSKMDLEDPDPLEAFDNIGFAAELITAEFDRLGLDQTISDIQGWRTHLRTEMLAIGLLLEREELLPVLQPRRPPASWLYDRPLGPDEELLSRSLSKKWASAIRILASLDRGAEADRMLSESIIYLISELNKNIATMNTSSEHAGIAKPQIRAQVLKILCSARTSLYEIAKTRELYGFTGML